MKDTIELRKNRAALVTEGRSILDKADTEKRELNADENIKYEKIMTDVDAMKNEIDKIERQSAIEAEMKASAGISSNGGKSEVGNSENRSNDRVVSKPEYRSAFNKFIINGNAALSADERSVLKTEEQRALSVGTGTAGGYTVPQGFRDVLEDALKFYGGVRKSRATIMKTQTGNALPMPSANDTTNIGELVNENSPVTAADIAFGQKILNAYKFSSKTVLVSLELLQDSAFDLETYIAQKLGERLGRSQNNYFTVGTGVSQPQGIVTGSTLGTTGAVGQITSIIYDDLVNLEHSVDPAYRQNAEFMFHDSTLKTLKKLKDNYGRPLWLPSIVANAPDQILGYDYVINNDMPIMAASAKSIVFGDLSKFIVRDVMDVTLFRIAEKYVEQGQVGFLAFYRGDSGLLDAGTHPITYYANSAT